MHACRKDTNHQPVHRRIEQTPPTSTWGTQFLTVPFAVRTTGDLFCIIVAEDVNGASAEVEHTLHAYDAEGNGTRLEAPSGTTELGYDALGRLTALHDPQGGTTTWGYDPAGQPTSMVQPNGVTTLFSHDLRGRLTGIVLSIT